MSAVDATGRRHSHRASPGLAAWGMLVYAFLYIPILALVVYSFTQGRMLEIWGGFSFDRYTSLPDDPAIRGAIATSMKAALGSAIIATILGSLAGVALARRPGRWVLVFMVLVFLVLVLPEVVDAVALEMWYVRLGGPFERGAVGLGGSDGLLRLWVGHSLFSMAVVTLIVRARLVHLDGSLVEAGADLYATRWRRFRQIVLPLMMPTVLAGGLLAFSLSLDNIVISTFVGVAEATPWPVVVFGSVRDVLRPEVAVISTLMLVLTLIALVLVALVVRDRGDATEEGADPIVGAG